MEFKLFHAVKLLPLMPDKCSSLNYEYLDVNRKCQFLDEINNVGYADLTVTRQEAQS